MSASDSSTAVGNFPAPPGVKPNFTNPSYVSGGIVPVSAVFVAISTLLVAIRLYTKIRIIKVFGSEDYVLFVAWLFNVLSTSFDLGEQVPCANQLFDGFLILVQVQQRNGNGIHMWDISMDKFIIYEKWAAATVVIYVPAVALAKVSILTFYLRINPAPAFRYQVFFVLFVTIGYMVAICFALIFQCHPIAKFWSPLIEGTCVHVRDLYLANGILNVIADFLVLLVPIPMLVALHVGNRQKLILGGLFATGSLTCIISAVRIYYVAQILNSDDVSRAVVTPTTLGVAETNLSVICACLMVLRPFVRKHLPFLLRGDTAYRYPGHPMDGLDHNTGTRNALDPTSANHSYQTKVSAGSAKHKTWLGISMGGRTASGSEDTAVGDEDLEAGGLEGAASLHGGKERAWPLRVQKSYAVQSARAPRSESKENIIDDVQGKPHVEE